MINSVSAARAEAAEKFNVDPSKFTINNANAANWAISKILTAEEEIELIKQQMQAEVEKFKLQIAGIEQDRKDFEDEFLAELEQWTRSNKVSYEKTIKLLQGNVGFKKLPSRSVVNDLDRLSQWANQTNNEVIKTEHKPVMSAINALVKKGIVPDGVEIIEGEERFYVTRSNKQDSIKNLNKALTELWEL